MADLVPVGTGFPPGSREHWQRSKPVAAESHAESQLLAEVAVEEGAATVPKLKQQTLGK